MHNFVIIIFLIFFAILFTIGAVKVINFVRGGEIHDLIIGVGFIIGYWIIITHEQMAAIPEAFGGDLSLVLAITILPAIGVVTLREMLRDVDQPVERTSVREQE
jgi:hypothetical protein